MYVHMWHCSEPLLGSKSQKTNGYVRCVCDCAIMDVHNLTNSSWPTESCPAEVSLSPAWRGSASCERSSAVCSIGCGGWAGSRLQQQLRSLLGLRGLFGLVLEAARNLPCSARRAYYFYALPGGPSFANGIVIIPSNQRRKCRHVSSVWTMGRRHTADGGRRKLPGLCSTHSNKQLKRECACSIHAGRRRTWRGRKTKQGNPNHRE